MQKYGWTIERLCPGPLPGEEERYLDFNILPNEWLVEQLNRATHFERMLEALQSIRVTLPGLDGDKGDLFDRVRSAIAKTEVKDDDQD